MVKFESQEKAFYILVYIELKTNWGRVRPRGEYVLISLQRNGFYCIQIRTIVKHNYIRSHTFSIFILRDFYLQKIQLFEFGGSADNPGNDQIRVDNLVSLCGLA